MSVEGRLLRKIDESREKIKEMRERSCYVYKPWINNQYDEIAKNQQELESLRKRMSNRNSY